MDFYLLLFNENHIKQNEIILALNTNQTKKKLDS